MQIITQYLFYNVTINDLTKGAGQNGTATKWHGRQNDTVHHFGTEGHFGTATKWHGLSI